MDKLPLRVVKLHLQNARSVVKRPLLMRRMVPANVEQCVCDVPAKRRLILLAAVEAGSEFLCPLAACRMALQELGAEFGRLLRQALEERRRRAGIDVRLLEAADGIGVGLRLV